MEAQSSDGVDRKVVEEMATILSLSVDQSIELHRDLYAAREQLEIRQAIAQRPKDTATVRRLERIEKSLARVAREAERATQQEDAHWRAALRAMARAGEAWAAEQQCQDLEELGFQPMQLGDHGVDYGADVVIERWLAMAPVILGLAVKAKEKLQADDNASGQQYWPGAMEWLVGKRLPELYEKFSCAAFRVTRDTYGDVVENEATKFVLNALNAMRINGISEYTIASHFGNYTRRSRAD